MTKRSILERTSVAVATAIILLALLACKKGAGADCNHNKDCKDSMVCSLNTWKCMTVESAKKDCEDNHKVLCTSDPCGIGPLDGDAVAVCQ